MPAGGLPRSGDVGPFLPVTTQLRLRKMFRTISEILVKPSLSRAPLHDAGIGRKGCMGFLERAPSLTNRAADEIRARIVQGVFRLGEPLSEITLANDLASARHPFGKLCLN